MRDRINKIIQTEQHTPSSFADAIGVSRSSMNHILNGRNNPSLDVASRILSTFPHINSDWLLFGKEPMYRNQSSNFQPDLFHQTVIKTPEAPTAPEYRKENELKEPKITPNEPIINHLSSKETDTKKIVKIIILYSDNTYDTLSNEK